MFLFSHLRTRCPFALPIFFLCGMSSSAVRAEELPTIEKIRSAIPDKPRAAPQKPRRVLVFSLPKGFVHASIPVGELMLRQMGEKTGAFTTVVSRDPEMFRARNLQQFDAVVMNNVSGELFTDPELRENLVRFVRDNGKGLVGIHGATTAFREWPEYGNMIGAYFNTHPWNAATTVTIKAEDPQHPVCAAFSEPTKTLVEEIYQFRRSPYSRSKVRVLVSLDTERTDMSLRGIDRFDNDFPVSWVRSYGKGRVFYSSLGHNYHIYYDPVLVQHFLDGIQFALGDLAAETEPRQDVAEDILIRALPGRLEAVRGYVYGAERSDLTNLDYLVSEAVLYPRTRSHYSRAIGELLAQSVEEQDSTMTLALPQHLARKLAELGTDESVSALEPLLRHKNPLLAEAAYLALGEIKQESAGEALRTALKTAPLDYHAGIAGVIGHRRDSKAVELLAELAAESTSASIAKAALYSLGDIGTQEAAQTLLESGRKHRDDLLRATNQALLKSAGRLAESGKPAAAATVLQSVMKSSDYGPERAAAFMGLAELNVEGIRDVAVDHLLGDDPFLESAAAAFLTQDRHPEAARTLMSSLTNSPPGKQVLTLRVLGDRQETSALELLKEKVRSPHEEVRIAALQSLGSMADATAIELLVRTAAAGNSQERAAARNSLARVPHEDADHAILSLLEQTSRDQTRESAKVRQELVSAIEKRQNRDALPQLLSATEDTDAGVRKRAYAALATLAGSEELEQIIKLLKGASPEAVRAEAERASLAAAARVADPEKREDLVAAALDEAEDPKYVASLVRILGKIGTADALKRIQAELLKAPASQEVRDALVRAVAEFPLPGAFDEALAIARSADNEIHRVLALRGAARMLSMSKDRPPDESTRLWNELMNLAVRQEDQKMILGEVAGTQEPVLLPFLADRLDTPELAQEAVAAILLLADKVCEKNPDACRDALLKVEEKGGDSDRKKAAAIRARIEKQKKP